MKVTSSSASLPSSRALAVMKGAPGDSAERTLTGRPVPDSRRTVDVTDPPGFTPSNRSALRLGTTSRRTPASKVSIILGFAGSSESTSRDLCMLPPMPDASKNTSMKVCSPGIRTVFPRTV